MRPGAVLAAALALSVGCGDDAAPTAKPPKTAPPQPEAKTAPKAEPDEPEIDREAAKPIDPVGYWRAKALGLVARSEATGADTYVVIKGQGPRVASTPLLPNPDLKSLGYREGIDTLVLELRDPAKREAAAARLHTLTKTDRGAWENWIAWHAEHGDFLVFNPELDRVEVDDKAKADRLAPAVDGVRVTLSTPDRVRRGKPWTIRVNVSNVGEAARQVCTRFEVGTELELQLRRDEPKDATPVDFAAVGSPGGPTAEDFVVLEPGTDKEWSVDLWELVPGELSPGQYRLRAVFRGASLPPSASPVAELWGSQAASLSRRVRVVEW